MTIYFIGGDFEFVKIGYTGSRNVSDRLASLQTGNPHELRVLTKCDGGREEERMLHLAFSESRACGEWFRYTDDLRMLIKYLKKGGLIGPWIAYFLDYYAANKEGRSVA